LPGAGVLKLCASQKGKRNVVKSGKLSYPPSPRTYRGGPRVKEAEVSRGMSKGGKRNHTSRRGDGNTHKKGNQIKREWDLCKRSPLDCMPTHYIERTHR